MPETTRPLLNMMPHAYRIRNWPDYFETSESRKIKGALTWVAVPTKHDGRGYKRATQAQNAVAALCGWWSMLQVAAKMPVHGLLADRDGPLDADDIAVKTNLPKKIYLTAFDVMSDPKIGWLEKVPWDQNLDFAGNIAALIASQHLPADALRFQRTPADTSGPQRRRKESPIPGATSGPQSPPAPASNGQHSPAESSGQQQIPAETSVQDRTDITNRPPAVPPGDSKPLPNLITSPDLAKELICKKILGGKDPARPWSYDAQSRLSELCANGGMPLKEILDVAAFRAIPKSDDVPELKKRVEPLTETGLMNYWGDEVQRARDYLKKYPRGGAMNGASREPARWREFFRWKYGEGFVLPSKFALLGDDEKKEWERDHEEWEAANTEPIPQ